MKKANVKGALVWSEEVSVPRAKLLGETIKCIRIDDIKNNIYYFEDSLKTPTTYDSLFLTLYADKLDKHTREEILKSDFRVYKVALEYEDSSYEEYQSALIDCPCCGRFLTQVHEDEETGEIVISVRTVKCHQII